MFMFIYPRIWPIAFLAVGLATTLGSHVHFNVLGLSIGSHNVMWFAMALAHADVFWRKRTESC